MKIRRIYYLYPLKSVKNALSILKSVEICPGHFEKGIEKRPAPYLRDSKRSKISRTFWCGVEICPWHFEKSVEKRPAP